MVTAAAHELQPKSSTISWILGPANEAIVACIPRMSHDSVDVLAVFQDVAFEFYRAGGSIAALRRSAAFAGSAMNLMKAAATSGCFDAASTPAPTCPYSISSAGSGPRYSVPGCGWITLVC